MLALALALALQDADYFPLKPGAAWTYRMSSGQAMEVKVVGTSNVGGQACAVVQTNLGPQKSVEHQAVTRDGLTAFKVENAAGVFEYPTPILRAKLPFTKGDTWQIRLQEGAQLNTYVYLTEGEEKIKVAAGDFDAWKVVATLRLPQGQAVMSSWYAKGVGLVKYVYEVNGQPMSAELSATSLAPTTPPPPRACSKCKAPDKAGGKFCAECGTPF